MTLPDLPLSVALIATALIGGLILLGAAALMGWRRANRQLLAAEQAAGDVALEALRRVEARIDRLQTLRSEETLRLGADLAALRSEIEWLTSERMIEQAAQMCRDGAGHDRIGSELGLSTDTVRTIALLRTH